MLSSEAEFNEMRKLIAYRISLNSASVYSSDLASDKGSPAALREATEAIVGRCVSRLVSSMCVVVQW